MNISEASKSLTDGHHKYVLFTGEYSGNPVFISKELINKEPGADNIQHIEIAQIAIGFLNIADGDFLRDFIDDNMGAGTCEPDGNNIRWVDGITGSMNSSTEEEFSLAVQNGVELV